MQRLKVILILALIPLCTWLGSLVPIGTGSGIVIGCLLGIALSCLFLIYGPGRKRSQLPSSYYLTHQHQVNGGANQQTVEINTLQARQAAEPPWDSPCGRPRR